MAAEPAGRRVLAFKLHERGLARVFGELEAEIMDAVWRSGSVTVGDVCVALGEGANYKTVTTVMNRLVEKRVLVRERCSRAFVYRAVDSREDFLGRVSRRVAEGLVRDFGDVAVAQFVDAVDTIDPALLAKLHALVEARTVAEDGS